MTDSRLDRWREPRTLMLYLGGEDRTLVQAAHEKRKKHMDTLRLLPLVEGARELIFDLSAEKPIFHIVGYYLNTEKFELQAKVLYQLSSSEGDHDEVERDIVRVLGIALALEVPVYPNTEREAAPLAKHYRELLLHGFVFRMQDGKEMLATWERSPKEKIDQFTYLHELDYTHLHPPAELVLIRDAVERELASRDEAGRVLATLRLAISELERMLSSEKRNEAALQRCLTTNPILFGPEYQRVIPKHRLGAEYEMDYALLRTSGLVDLVEIESSSLRLFNAKGDPSSFLVHAEQQVLNWLDWIGRNESYARESLPGVMRPVGYVVIGRSNDLSDAERRRLALRNSVLAPTVQVLTYDDLLGRAVNLLRLLSGSTASA